MYPQYSRWICDTCGLPILNLEHALVQWPSPMYGAERRVLVLRLIVAHKQLFSPLRPTGRCDYDERTVDIQDYELSTMHEEGVEERLVTMAQTTGQPKEAILQLAERIHHIRAVRMPRTDYQRPYFLTAEALQRVRLAIARL